MEKRMKNSNLGIASMILGIIGVLTSCILIGIIPAILALVFSIVGLAEKNKRKEMAVVGFVISILGILIFVAVLFIIVPSITIEDSTNGLETTEPYEERQKEAENKSEEIISSIEVEPEKKEEETEEQNTETTETNILEEDNIDGMTEDDYKNNCNELFFDDIFFGDNDLEGNYVKLHLFISEKYFFTEKEIMFSDSFKQLNDNYNIYRDFFKCCVLHEGELSYFGEQINLLFSENYDLIPDDYECGDHIVIYGKIIDWSNNTWNGYNAVTVMPKYIESED